MMSGIKNRVKKIFSPKTKELSQDEKIEIYLKSGQKPWSLGYEEYKWKYIAANIQNDNLLEGIKKKSLQEGYGKFLDERCIEYPWIFTYLNQTNKLILDAGSTFNFKPVVEHPVIKRNNLTIYTFYPEAECFYKNRINYVFGDLRDMLFKDRFFDVIVSQSTIEHIDMDNSIYGYTQEEKVVEKSYEYLKAINEYVRVLNNNGLLLITFPFGKFENHGFFQQFDTEMLARIEKLLRPIGELQITFFKYEKSGWRFAEQEELASVVSFNPHTGKGKLDDNAAHCRSIACIRWIKN